MDETVTEQALFDEADFADAEENEASPAVEESKESSASQDEPTEAQDDSNANEPQPGDEIEEFLAKKHIDKSDPDALRKVADMYRNAEKELGRNYQEKAKLERQIAESINPVSEPTLNQQQPALNPEATLTNAMNSRIQALERQIAADRQVQATKEWKAAKNLSPEAEAKMIEFLRQPIVQNGVTQKDNQGRPLTRYFLVSAGALSLDDVYRAVGGDSIKAEAIKQELKTAIAKEVAAKQTAKSNPLATNSTQFTDPTKKDPFIEGLFED